MVTNNFFWLPAVIFHGSSRCHARFNFSFSWQRILGASVSVGLTEVTLNYVERLGRSRRTSSPPQARKIKTKNSSPAFK
jgi:hypothetical protein